MMSGEPASSSTALPFILQQWSSCRSQKKLAAHHHLHYTFPRLIFSSLAFPTHGFSHLSLRLARTPLQHEVAPKSTGKGRNGAGDVVVGAHASHESAGVPPPAKKKKETTEKKSISSWEGVGDHKKLVFSRGGGMVWPGAALGLSRFGSCFVPQTRLKSRFYPQNTNRGKRKQPVRR